VTLVDRANHHLFQPLLYQVATAGLSPGDIAEPIRALLRKQLNARVLLAAVSAIDCDKRQVAFEDGGTLSYDFLVLATGARHAYFGNDEWEQFAPGLKSLEDALYIRRRILLAFERAERATERAEQSALLTFVVVGGGATGVELAGAIAEIARQTVARDFRTIHPPSQAQVLLVEGGSRILSAFPEDLSRAAVRSLARLGVSVRTNAQVTRVTSDAVHIGDEVIPTHTALWAAGVAASPLGKWLGAPLDRGGRVLVEADLSVPGRPEVFVVGDLAAFTHTRKGTPLPGLAPVAMQQGTATARNIVRSIQGQPRRTFHYRDRGTMATVGRAAGVCQIGPLRLSGLLGWLTWLIVHIYFLIGFENRVLVLLQWSYSYFTYERGARLITGVQKLPASEEHSLSRGVGKHAAH
jgi:NADH dehydrogenase